MTVFMFCSPFCVVDSVPEAWRVNDGEPQFDSLLFNADAVSDDVDCLTDPFCRRSTVKK